LWDVIYPTSTFRTRWDLYMLVLFVYVCIALPYIICFGVEAPLGSPLGVLDMLVNVSFGLDVFLNFRTAYLGMTILYTINVWGVIMLQMKITDQCLIDAKLQFLIRSLGSWSMQSRSSHWIT